MPEVGFHLVLGSPTFSILVLFLCVYVISSRVMSATSGSSVLLSHLLGVPPALTGPLSLVYVTTPTAEVAKKLSHGLISQKLAACVNILPGVTSVYEWEGQVNEDSEVLMVIKTRSSRIHALTQYITENHPYSVCEVIATDITAGNPPYLDWVRGCVPDE